MFISRVPSGPEICFLFKLFAKYDCDAMLLYKVECEIFFSFRIIGNLYYKAAVLVHLYWSVIRVRSRTTILFDEAGKRKIMVIT